MLYMEKEIAREKATPIDEPPENLPANGGAPDFGSVLGHGLAVGTLGGIACNFVLMVTVALFLFLNNLFTYGMDLGAIISGVLGVLLFLAIGTIVAAPIGLAIGGVSAALMWLGLKALPKRDEETRRKVGMICAAFVAILATLIAAALLGNPSQSGWYATLTQPMMWVFVPEAIVVTLTGGWFAKRYL